MVIWALNIVTLFIFLFQEQGEMEHKVCRTSLKGKMAFVYLVVFSVLILLSIISSIIIKGNINEILEESQDEATKQKLFGFLLKC